MKIFFFQCFQMETSSPSTNTLGSLVDPSLQACKTRAVLTEAQAVEIFLIKIANDDVPKRSRRSAAAVARQFGVSDKAVRDIWTGRTWFRELMHLDPARAAMPERLKRPGRPRGRRDAQPTRKQDKCSSDSTSTSSASDGDGHDDAYSGSSPATTPLADMVCPDLQNIRILPIHLPPFIPGDSGSIPGTQHSSGCAQPTPRQQAADAQDGPQSLASSGCFDAKETAAPLPESSSADDPFHDDWRFWPPAAAGNLDGGGSDGAQAKADEVMDVGEEEMGVLLWGRWARHEGPPSSPTQIGT